MVPRIMQRFACPRLTSRLKQQPFKPRPFKQQLWSQPRAASRSPAGNSARRA
jgi:hypothetical protein